MGKSSKRNRGGASRQAPNAANGSAAPRPSMHPQAQRSANLGSMLIHFGVVWLIVGVLVKFGNDARDGKLSEAAGSNFTASAAAPTNGTVTGLAVAPASGGENMAASVAAANDVSSVGLVTAPAFATDTDSGAGTIIVDGFSVPKGLLGPMGSYPDPLNLTDEARKGFHPVVKFPEVWVDANPTAPRTNGKRRWRPPWDRRDRTRAPNFVLKDHRRTTGESQLVPSDRAEEYARERRRAGFRGMWGIGRYDEDRALMYSSDMFLDESHDIDGYRGARTIHMGVDLGGPVGTKVYAFTDGVIHSAGYNAGLGDYGYVVVVQHVLPSAPLDSSNKLTAKESAAGEDEPLSTEKEGKVYALYGHLDAKSIRGKTAGRRVRKGQVLGRIGDVYENGGWSEPHVHFQLSMKEPYSHDMPGAVSLADRPRALVHYPDPRIVLGPLY